ncbi:AraC family transcriptional regulator [Alphaproteobacteria bacterium]|nr:AraC family transcriptional regulator [Alphaproteobacteria bacterium]
MDALNFNIPEILSLVGVAFCLHIIVYMAFRSGRIARAMLPMIYFFIMGLSFLSNAAMRHWSELIPYYEDIAWALWFLGPPFSVLLIIQIAQISRVPALRHYWVLFLVPIAYVLSRRFQDEVENFQELLTIVGLIVGGISLLAIWLNKNLFKTITAEKKTGKERYWLILAIIIANIAFLSLTLASISVKIDTQTFDIARTILGLAFIYLINTSLFRIYPQAVEVLERRTANRLTEEELKTAKKVENLLNLDKVYQEPAYSRADLAKECDTSEAIISKIINGYFKKSFPQLMNEHRIEDAKRMLTQTDAPVKTVSEEVGFNALASFNRVFKDMTGQSPSNYRKNT